MERVTEKVYLSASSGRKYRGKSRVRWKAWVIEWIRGASR